MFNFFYSRLFRLKRPFLLGCFLLLPSVSSAAIGPNFQARVTIALCPEYPLGNVSLEIKYTSFGSNELISPTIVSQSIDSGNNTATVEILLPSYFQFFPFQVYAFCRSTAQGLSNASNAASISNCDALALLDEDSDGIPNNIEDTNCDNFYSPGDISNPNNADTDGDGVADLAELLSGFDPSNPGSSPRPYVYSGAPFDPDVDGTANPVVWRPSEGRFYVRDVSTPGNHVSIQFGLTGDIPFTYKPKDAASDVGVIRVIQNQLNWYFNGRGFVRSDNSALTQVQFGIFGDNILPGPWEEPGVTSPAVARLFANQWFFDIYLRNGSVRQVLWGGNGDIPKIQDYDGDGLFDVAVWRPREQKTYIIRSSNQAVLVLPFGTGTSDYTFRGDVTGDGIGDLTFWEPITAIFYSLTSDNGFNPTAGAAKDPNHYRQMQLGIFGVHVPLSWNLRNGKIHYTVVDHAQGLRYWRENNNPNGNILNLQWGLPGDSQG